jgi:hypothetical protein
VFGTHFQSAFPRIGVNSNTVSATVRGQFRITCPPDLFTLRFTGDPIVTEPLRTADTLPAVAVTDHW